MITTDDFASALMDMTIIAYIGGIVIGAVIALTMIGAIYGL